MARPVTLQGSGEIRVTHFPDVSPPFKAYVAGVNTGVNGYGESEQEAVADLRLKLATNGWTVSD